MTTNERETGFVSESPASVGEVLKKISADIERNTAFNKKWEELDEDTQAYILYGTSRALSAQTPDDLRDVVSSELDRIRTSDAHNAEKIFGDPGDSASVLSNALRVYWRTPPAIHTALEQQRFSPNLNEEIAVGKDVLQQLRNLTQTDTNENTVYFPNMQRETGKLLAQLVLTAQGQVSHSKQNLRGRMNGVEKYTQEVMKIEIPFSSRTARSQVAWINRTLLQRQKAA